MDLKFVVNDYILIWNLLFGVSISESIYNLKQRLWKNYKEEYNKAYQDKCLILKDSKNFIPSDDTIYNVVLETKEYEKLRKQVEKYRLEVVKIWDSNKKYITILFKKIIRKDIDNYLAFIVNEELDIIDVSEKKSKEKNTLIFGKKNMSKRPLKTVLELILEIIKREIKGTKTQNEIKDAIIELAVLNEFATIIEKKSCYLTGTSSLAYLKRQIYPYWLMYLGIPKEEFTTYMRRDKIIFDADRYAYEKELKKMDLEEFIDFCTRNIKYIVRTAATIN